MKTILALFCGTLLALTLPCPSFADTAYTIKKGDNLYTIAKHHGVSVDRIKEANGLGTNRLMPGTKITIPSKGSPDKRQAAAKKTPAPAPAHEKRVQGDASPVTDAQYHTVQKGDTLQSVAKKYSLPVADLKEMNNISRVKRLKAGQQLLVKRTGPRTYTVRKGDSLPKIAKRLGITEEDIKFLNDLETDDIKQGQKLLVEEWSEPENARPFTTMISAATLRDDIKTMTESTELASLDLSDRVTLFAKKLLGIPYRFGGSSFMGIDCSAYVQKVFGFLNVPLPRSAREQFHVGEPVNKDDLSIGDLVFFRTYASFPSHVGIYMGNNLFIHASSKGRKVTIDSLETPYYVKRFIGAKRLLNGESEEKKDTDKEG